MSWGLQIQRRFRGLASKPFWPFMRCSQVQLGIHSQRPWACSQLPYCIGLPTFCLVRIESLWSQNFDHQQNTPCLREMYLIVTSGFTNMFPKTQAGHAPQPLSDFTVQIKAYLNRLCTQPFRKVLSWRLWDVANLWMAFSDLFPACLMVHGQSVPLHSIRL